MSDESLVRAVEVEEHEDGSATVQLDMTPEGLRMLVQEGFVAILKKAIEEEKVYYDPMP